MNNQTVKNEDTGNNESKTQDTGNNEEQDIQHLLIDRIVVEESDSRVRDLYALQGLMDSIKERGINKILLVESQTYKLIAGRRTLEACRRLGWPSVPVRMVKCSKEEAELRRIDDNLYHLSLTVLEEGEHLIRREEILKGMGKLAPNHRPKKGAKFADFVTTADEARAFKMSERTAQERKQIVGKLTAESRERIRNTPIADNAQGLKSLSKMEAEQQAKVLDLYFEQVARQELVKPGTTDRQSATILRKALGRVKRDERISEIVSDSYVPVDEVGGRYSVIYADPPWQYTRGGAPTGGTPETHYETMALEEICALPVGSVTADDAVLFLWTTKTHLMQANEVIRAWGFEYKSWMVWVKDDCGKGCYSRENAELLIIATKGALPRPLPEHLEATAVFAPREEHAKKPEKFYEIIETYYCEYRRVELFSRCPRPGWGCWGNEVIPVGEEELQKQDEETYLRMRDADITAQPWGGSALVPHIMRLAA